MVDTSDDVEFKLAIGSGLEDSGVDFDLFDPRTVQCAQSRDDTGLLPGSRRTVDEKVRKVGTLSLANVSVNAQNVSRWVNFTRLRRRSDRSS